MTTFVILWMLTVEHPTPLGIFYNMQECAQARDRVRSERTLLKKEVFICIPSDHRPE